MSENSPKGGPVPRGKKFLGGHRMEMAPKSKPTPPRPSPSGGERGHRPPVAQIPAKPPPPPPPPPKSDK